MNPSQINRVLVLGVGGGAVINLLNHFIQPATIIGLDLDAVHLKLARRYFRVAKSNAKLVRAEATAWVADYSGPRFDLVIEDLFKSDNHGQPIRAVATNTYWLKSLQQVLQPAGVLVMNHESSRQVTETASIASNLFQSALQLKTTKYENAIGVFSNSKLESKKLSSRLLAFKELDRRFKTCKLDFSLRRL